MSPDIKNIILNAHNQLRNKIALGKQSRFSPAVRMLQTVWSDDLAYLARLNARSCIYAHDLCHNTRNILNID